MFTEKEAAQKIKEYFINRNYKILEQIKIRGRIIDIVAVNNNEISLIEVKGGEGDILRGIAQAIHCYGCGNYSYLALPKEKLTDDLKNTCKNLGIGIIVSNKRVKQVLKPKRTESLESVRSLILNFKPKVKKERTGISILERLFTSKSRVEILKLLIFSQEDIHLREIARRTSVSAPYVKKEIENLKKMNLITEMKRGNMKIFKINKNSAIYEDLKKIFLKTEVLGDVIKENLKDVKQIKYALIFGSFARGEESERSDIDLLIVGNLKEDIILDIVRKSESKIGREINYILWSEKDFEKRAKESHHLLKDIINKPVIMLRGDFDEFRKFVKK